MTTENPNPYQAPTSNVNPSLQETYQPEVFTHSGRIGRLRYLAYSMINVAMLVLLFSIAFLFGSESGSGLGLVIVGAAYVIFIVYRFMLMKRRFNDMDKSGWFSLLSIIPLVNLVIALWLIFGEGSLMKNRFGPMPNENPLSVKIFGLLGPALVIVGFIAAISLPAYQDYVKRAEAIQAAE